MTTAYSCVCQVDLTFKYPVTLHRSSSYIMLEKEQSQNSFSPVRMVRKLSERKRSATLDSSVTDQKLQFASQASVYGIVAESNANASYKSLLPSEIDTGPAASPDEEIINKALMAPRRTDAGPATPEAGVDECRNMIESLHSNDPGGRGVRVNAGMLLWIHRLNKCFMGARSYSHGCELANRAVQHHWPLVKTESVGSGTIGRGVDATAAPPGTQGSGQIIAGAVVSALVSLVASGEPHVILVINCLIFLAIAKEAVYQMNLAGLVPLLAGQLRHKLLLEDQLVEACQSLLVTLVQADVRDPQHPVIHQHMECLLTTCALFLNANEAAATSTLLDLEVTQEQQQQQQHLPETSHQYRCVKQAVQLLSELACTHEGAECIKSSPKLQGAAVRFLDKPSEIFSDLQRKLRQILKLTEVLHIKPAK
ncbi:hypothetical protein CEUSTIGMA_g5638.t1 [Chlamydomonas eustigma]|uniref:Uncharacterized protein n=1 Tax=Chlamydomonas eustigma TaxID=1157962 RepID=A0A250X574_9CHLO|nr:hypothetical protein CEUSTIGMA_g5638.t1 [Chlamydomonas eustigma]|eukprot:GAX78196.1 hypothetical protein CEUSTIGMA_g5638.t1 [Chlamydomonas eustigma]